MGVVETVNPMERIARVKWLPPGATGQAPPAGATSTAAATAAEQREEVSVYELQEHLVGGCTS